MDADSHFDFIVIGNGLAGLQLSLSMASDNYFKNKTIALIDPSKKTHNDKTWSFWEKNPSIWNDVVFKSWDKASIITTQEYINLNLAPYQYKSIKSLDFYNSAKLKLEQYPNIFFIYDLVISTTDTNIIHVAGKLNNYTAKHVFDSRIPIAFKTCKNSISLKQHFKGIVIKTETSVFNDDTFTMMDYRLKDGEQTTFMYVLPYCKNMALIEFTYFTEHTVNNAVYDGFIKEYIERFLNIKNYTIVETEQGNIPMTTFSFERYNTASITKIGTGGGWVKASTGYSFKHTEKKVAKIINNIKFGRRPSYNLIKKKYKFYDKVFLQVLKDENHKGEWIFQQFYKKNKTETMLKFLDEESSLYEELKIMSSLFSWRFIKAFFKTL